MLYFSFLYEQEIGNANLFGYKSDRSTLSDRSTFKLFNCVYFIDNRLNPNHAVYFNFLHSSLSPIFIKLSY